MTNPSQAVFEDSDDKERNPTVRKILSNVAGVSEDTYSRVKKFLIQIIKNLNKRYYQGRKVSMLVTRNLRKGKIRKRMKTKNLQRG